MRVAYALAAQALPDYSSKFSRHDFTLPQLMACLVVKEQMKRSYRGVEALLHDSMHWCRDIGMRRVPDHNTLQRAAAFLLRKYHANKLLDVTVQWAAVARMLKLSQKPLTMDSTYFESHHVSRYYERRRRSTAAQGGTKAKAAAKSHRRRTVSGLPKLAISAAAACHVICSYWCGSGMGADHPQFEPVLYDAWRRVPNRRFGVAADAGYDSHKNHQVARKDMGLASLIPPDIGRKPGKGVVLSSPYRQRMRRLLATRTSRRRCGYTQRWQSETVNSMIKRNLGSALSGKSAASRKRDMTLKVITHNVMVLPRRVETEHF